MGEKPPDHAMPPVRVLYVNHTSVMGGAEEALVEHLRIMPLDCGAGPVLCPPGELAEKLRARGFEVETFRGTAVSFRFTVRSLTKAVFEFVTAARLMKRAARNAGCEVVHANSIRAGLMASLARMVGGPPVIVHVHDVLPPGPVSRLIRGLLLKRSAALVAVSQFSRDAFTEGVRSVATPFPVINNPLDVDGLSASAPTRTRARELLGLPPGSPVLGMIGQITPWKRQDTAIRALAEVLKVWPDAQLLIVGEARFVDPSTRYDNRAYRQRLDRLVDELGVSHAVHFLGQRDDVPVLMRALDLLLLPSTVEPLARVALEAMVLGTPILATSVGGLPEVLADERTGFLLPPDNAVVWAARIVDVLDDPARMAEVSERGRSSIIKRLASEHYVESMTSLYRTVVAEEAHVPPHDGSALSAGADPRPASQSNGHARPDAAASVVAPTSVGRDLPD